MDKMRGCNDIAKIISFSCCVSCHEDEDEGFCGMPEFEHNGIEYHACCAAMNALNDYIKESEANNKKNGMVKNGQNKSLRNDNGRYRE